MNTHTKSETRRLALLGIYASLCSVLTLQLAVQWASATTALRATTAAFEVSALPGTHGIDASDLRPAQLRSIEAQRKARVRKMRTAAPVERAHNLRSR